MPEERDRVVVRRQSDDAGCVTAGSQALGPSRSILPNLSARIDDGRARIVPKEQACVLCLTIKLQGDRTQHVREAFAHVPDRCVGNFDPEGLLQVLLSMHRHAAENSVHADDRDCGIRIERPLLDAIVDERLGKWRFEDGFAEIALKRLDGVPGRNQRRLPGDGREFGRTILVHASARAIGAHIAGVKKRMRVIGLVEFIEVRL
jgi:hypothetical protein